MSENRLRRAITERRTALGAWCVTPSPFNAEVFASTGFEYVCVDCQHGLVGYDAMVPMLGAISRTEATPVVRVPHNGTAWIGHVLDTGAEAVIVPMVDSADDAERAVAASRYAPEGVRSFGPVRAALYLNQSLPTTVNTEVLCFVMVETVGAVEQVDAICAVPGVDGVYIGPADLAISMGAQPGGPMPAAHGDAIAHIAQTCRDRGIAVGIHTSGGDDTTAAVKAGFDLVTVTSDAAMLRTAAANHLERARRGTL